MALSVIRGAAPFLVAIGGIADKVGLWRALDMTRLTQSEHWLCTAAMVLMPVSAPIKVLV
jgi:hypothetical protein